MNRGIQQGHQTPALVPHAPAPSAIGITSPVADGRRLTSDATNPDGARWDLPTLYPRGNKVGQIGDSILAGQSASGGKSLLFASILDNARYRFWFAADAAVSGGTALSAILTQLPVVIANKPDWCVVMLGANDYSTTAFNLWRDQMTTIYDTLEANGIRPIAVVPPPRNSATIGQMLQFGTWVRVNAERRGFPLVDQFSTLVDPATADGDWISTYSADGTHPNPAGTAVMVANFRRDLANVFAPAAVPLAVTPSDTTNMFTNALMLTDTDADGQPDGWSGGVVAGIGLTRPADTNSPAFGNLWQLNRTDATVATQVYSFTLSSLGSLWGVGDRIAISGRFQCTGGCWLIGHQFASVVTVNQFVVGDSSSTGYTIADGVFYYEIVVPPGTTALTFRYTALKDAGATVTGSARIGQLSARNLTTALAVAG